MLQFPAVPLRSTEPHERTTSRPRVAVVDVVRPDPLIAALDGAGYTAEFAEAASLRHVQSAEIIVFGPALSDGERLQLISVVAQRRGRLIFDVSAHDLPIVRARALRAGADDAVAWNASPEEVLARLDALARRLGVERTTSVIEAGPVVIDPVGREAWADGRVLDLTTKEFDLLQTLAANPGRVFTRHELLVRVWQSSAAYQGAGTVTEHVRRVRNKLDDRAAMLETVRGVGYRFERRRSSRSSAELLHAG